MPSCVSSNQPSGTRAHSKDSLTTCASLEGTNRVFVSTTRSARLQFHEASPLVHFVGIFDGGFLILEGRHDDSHHFRVDQPLDLSERRRLAEDDGHHEVVVRAVEVKAIFGLVQRLLAKQLDTLLVPLRLLAQVVTDGPILVRQAIAARLLLVRRVHTRPLVALQDLVLQV